MNAILAFIVVILHGAIGRIRAPFDRFIVKHLISGNKELSPLRLFSWKFISSLGWKGYLGLAITASFTLVTYPLGVWIASTTMNLSYPITYIAGNVTAMFMHPITLLITKKALGEFVINDKTILGLVIVEIAAVIGMIGWYLVYEGNMGL